MSEETRMRWFTVSVVAVFFLLDTVVTMLSLFSTVLGDIQWTDVARELYVTMPDDDNFSRDTFNLTPTMGWWVGFHFARIVGFIVIGSGLIYTLTYNQPGAIIDIGSVFESLQWLTTLLYVLAFGLQTAQTFVVHYVMEPWLTVSILIGCQVLVFMGMIGMVAYDFWGLRLTDVARLLGPRDQKFITNVHVYAVHSLHHVMIFFWATWSLLWLVETGFRAVRDADSANQERLERIVDTSAPVVFAVVAGTLLIASTAFARHMWVPVPIATLFHAVSIVVRGSDALTHTTFIVSIVVSAVAFAMMLVHLAMFTFPFMRGNESYQSVPLQDTVYGKKVNPTSRVATVADPVIFSTMSALRNGYK